MRWAEISVEATPASADAVTEILLAAGCGGTAASTTPLSSVILSGAKNLDRNAEILRCAQDDEHDRVFVTGYLPVDDRLEASLESIRERVRSLPGLGLELCSDEISVRWVEDDDWATAWKKFFKPIRFGRVVVKPSWEREAPAEPGDVIVEIDPGMAFGTGNHPTTALCLMALQDYLIPSSVILNAVKNLGPEVEILRVAQNDAGLTVLDVGTGSGILAIAAAKLGAARVVGLDIDPVAVRIARENVANAGLDGIIHIREADSPLAFEGIADLVVANIVPNVIMAMAEALREKLRPGGRLITSGIVVERADEVRAKLEGLGLATLEERIDGDWVALISERGTTG